MRTLHHKTGFPSIWSLLLLVLLAACGSDSSDGKTVTVNLSLVVDGRQAEQRAPFSRLFAWFERWYPGISHVWAQQAVTDITRINVQITGPGIPVPATADATVTDPTSDKEIPVTIQAPVGPGRTITVTAFNSANAKIFAGTLPNVNLTAGAPINLEIVLKRLVRVRVEKEGNGSGTVTSIPAGIDCGATCEGQFEEGTQVSLIPSAATGSSFDRWNGDCSGNGDCFVMGDSTVVARFIVPASTNHLHVEVGGSGAVSSAPNGIACPPACDADFETGRTVRLTARPSDGWTLSRWNVAGCTDNNPTCSVVMNSDQSVMATFNTIVPVPMSTLTVEKSGTGSGTVRSAPTGINCGGTCSTQFPTDFTVTLTPAPATGSTFAGWSGDCAGTSCVLTMNTDRRVSAQFDLVVVPPTNVTLTVNKQGNGDGTVTSDPAGIVCGGTCQFSYPRGTTVRLTATPNEGSSFNDWHGGGPCDNSSSLTCVLQMNDDETVSAHFDNNGRGGGGGRG
jgi:hypothetical protein